MRFLLIIFALIAPHSAVGQTAEEGYQAYNSGQYEKAESIIIPLVEKGDPIAMNALGKWYSDGILREKNREKACDWYEKSAHAGYPSAQFNYANCFDSKGGRKTNAKEHLNWMTKAAKQSYLDAQLSLLFWYFEKDKTQAQYWGEKAAAQNNTTARVALWMAQLDHTIPPVTIKEIACVVFFNMLLNHDWRTCDN